MTTTTDNLDEVIEVCERGWTNERPTVSGYYWLRYLKFDKPRCEYVLAGRVLPEGLEFLGPISPDDPQRCVALLKELKEKRAWMKYGGCTCMGHGECNFCKER